MATPINIFIIYAREDKEEKKILLDFLSPMIGAYDLTIWHDDHIQAGQEWKPRIESRLNTTDIFILLVSVNFLNSKFINQVEFKYALDRHRANKSIIIPVIIKHCLWDDPLPYDNYSFSLSQLQVLPTEGKPISEWKTTDEAYINIAKGIRAVIIDRRNNQQKQGLQEEESWNQAVQKNSISSYNEYLRNYPQGKFYQEAKNEVISLEKNEKEAFERNSQEIEMAKKESETQKIEEEILWKSTCDINTIIAYNNYLEKSKLASYREQANKIIAEIEKKNRQMIAEPEPLVSEVPENKLSQKPVTDNTSKAIKQSLRGWATGIKKNPSQQFRTDGDSEEIKKKNPEMIAEQEPLLSEMPENKLWEHTKTENTTAIIKEKEDAERKQQEIQQIKQKAPEPDIIKKRSSKKYFLIGGSVVLIGIIILVAIKFNNPASVKSENNKQAVSGKTEELTRADAYYNQKNFDSAASIFIRNSETLNAEEQYNLGEMYFYGTGVPNDKKEAVKWYQKAADQANANAQNSLGVMYQDGKGVPEDDKEAVKWYQKAADQGNAAAQNNLGRMYDEGFGVPEDDKEAVKWYQKAADQGNAAGQYDLGCMYEEGTGVNKNKAEAVKWYRKAADQDYPAAKDKLIALNIPN